jgi:aryl-alcohol dehydrogenase-like predicted oxidoreductase
LAPAYDHPGLPLRLAALDAVVAETGFTRNQGVLAWLLGQEISPIVGVTTAAQVSEAMDARRLELTAGQLDRLDTAG